MIKKDQLYLVSSKQVIEKLQTRRQGLSQKEAKKKLKEFGPNKIKEKKSFNALKLLVNQFINPLIILLAFAAIFSILIDELIDAVAIITIILINGILGFLQEYKAEKSIQSIKKLETLKSRVIRDNKEKTINSELIVPGDIISLHEGEKIPADARIIKSYDLNVDESMLTGESSGVEKNEATLNKKVAISDQKNMIFAGCTVNKGRAIAVVIKTGMHTQMGQIADQIQEHKEELTPLQKAMNRLAKLLGLVSILVAMPGLLIGIYLDRDIMEMIMTAISLAVSTIPEGMPVVVTIALALGIKRMVKVDVLVRKLSTVETLGGVDVICSDKTGTMTHNQITLTKLVIPDQGIYNISGKGFEPKGEFSFNKKESNTFFNKKNVKPNKKAVLQVIKQSILCSDASIDFGDTTERALVVAGRKLSINEENLRKKYTRINEIPFNSDQKYMAVTVKDETKTETIIKGAPEIIVQMCNLTKKQKKHYLKITNQFSSQGLRVLAMASKQTNDKNKKIELSSLKLNAIFAMYDPPREQVKKAIKTCQSAGIRVIMITGDHKKTAKAIAEKIHLQTDQVITGIEIDEFTKSEFNKVIKKTNVFARVSPRHKVKILTSLQKLGHQIAMTGDGVNDAPSIKKADIGIAVGSGTDLTKSVSDMIILDDDFSTIPKGVREGRRVFFNIKKFVRFLLSANFDEIAHVISSILLRLPLSFIPLQILWLNLVTDSFPALALAVDPEEKNIMSKKPYKPSKEILHGTIPFALLAGIFGYIFSFSLYLISLFIWNRSIEFARTISFSCAVFYEFFLVFSIRSDQSFLKYSLFNNIYLWLSIIFGAILQIGVIYLPLGHKIFKTVPLKPSEFIIMIIFASSGFILIESGKIIHELIVNHLNK